MLESSILNSVKKTLGLAPDYKAFDDMLVVHINSALSTLTDLGVGPIEGFSIAGDEETWAAFLGSEPWPGMGAVQSYVYLKTRQLFDPPTTSYLLDAMQKQIDQQEWRINVNIERWNATRPIVTP